MSSSIKSRAAAWAGQTAWAMIKNGQVWLQGALIANGLAMARPTPANPELAEKMYTLEDQARQAKSGIWADTSAHRLVEASNDIQPLDRFAVVEGTVKTVAIIRNVTYLNFGDDYRKDFTIGIPSTQRQALARSGIDLFKLQGQKVRVRGWLRLYNGPYIELEHPVLFQQVKNEQNNNTDR
jgi:micrococcal nuclease